MENRLRLSLPEMPGPVLSSQQDDGHVGDQGVDGLCGETKHAKRIEGKYRNLFNYRLMKVRDVLVHIFTFSARFRSRGACTSKNIRTTFRKYICTNFQKQLNDPQGGLTVNPSSRSGI